MEGRYKRYGYFEYDTEGEIERYKVRSFSARAARFARACITDPVKMFVFFIESRTSIGIGRKAAPVRYRQRWAYTSGAGRRQTYPR